ncbi:MULTISPECIES: hypothetical protein [unclassified Streptomyces]|uniref:hypothetical protein n=1 Tax=unclassified Streptomyces TaxID=2593676 RepID=UPI00081D74A6|nr:MULTISPECIES: hypothetical protein [unclassified Streptomyces]SCF67724.1 hypothetical protein GA0115259_1009130 [Streptomyces sp. MnatMP-M17]
MSARKDRQDGPDRATGPDAPLNDLTGNGIVNNGPDNELSGLGHTGAGSSSGSGGSRDGGAGASGAGGETGAGGIGGVSGAGGAKGSTGSHEPGGDAGGDAGHLNADLGGEPGRDLDGDVGGSLDGLDMDELALRRLLHGAVDDLRPSEGALDHLRKAVPTRRARKRQAVVGMAAAALLFGTAVPAFVHVANSGGTADDHSVNAGHGEQAQGGTGTSKDSGGGAGEDPHHPADQVSPDADDPDKVAKPEDTASGGTAEGGTAGTADPGGGTQSSSLPTCAPNQLQITVAEAGAPDSGGKVYGTFRVANASGTDCSVTGRGTVDFQTGGAADKAKITVVTHTAGDAATGLPDPSLEAAAVTLAPNSAYEVKFAWVPAESCPTTGASPDPTPSGDSSAGAGTGGGTGTGTDAGAGTGTNAEPQLLTEGGTMDGTVSVVHTPEPGAPVAEATIPNACAGTIYRTGVLNAP